MISTELKRIIIITGVALVISVVMYFLKEVFMFF